MTSARDKNRRGNPRHVRQSRRTSQPMGTPWVTDSNYRPAPKGRNKRARCGVIGSQRWVRCAAPLGLSHLLNATQGVAHGLAWVRPLVCNTPIETALNREVKAILAGFMRSLPAAI